MHVFVYMGFKIHQIIPYNLRESFSYPCHKGDMFIVKYELEMALCNMDMLTYKHCDMSDSSRLFFYQVVSINELVIYTVTNSIYMNLKYIL